MTYYATGLARQALLGQAPVPTRRTPGEIALIALIILVVIAILGVVAYFIIEAQKVPDGGTIFDAGRTLATGVKRGPNFFPAIKIDTKTCQSEFGKNAFWDAVGDRCYSCRDMNVNVFPSVLDKNKCSKPGVPDASATPERQGLGPAGLTLPDKSKGQFYVGDQIWQCPPRTARNPNQYDNKIDGPRACIGSCESLYPKTDSSTEPKEHQAAFFDVFQASCWSCPEGYNRTAAGVNAPNACIK